MIRKNDEGMGGEKEKLVNSFKRFSELSNNAKPDDNSDLPSMPDTDEKIPMNPNLPKKNTKVGKFASTDYMMPNANINKEYKDKTGYTGSGTDSNKNESSVEFYGRIAKLPKGIKASSGYNFLENVKVSKSSIWYLMVEKQDNMLQMVKYNHKKGVDLSKFVSDLKEYYIAKYRTNPKIVKLVESIEIAGNDKYSCIKNIPLIEFGGKKMISKITEDLIKLLSK